MKLIIPEKLKDKLYYHDMTGAPELSIAYQMGWNDAVKNIIESESLTIEAEQVVRCKDCEYYNGEDKYCVNDIFAKPNGYCMYGESK